MAMHHTQTPTTASEQLAADAKRFSTSAARAARAGHELRQVGANFVLSRWTYSKHVADLDAVESLLAQIEGVAV
jgi:hypothetical protein